MFANLFFSHGGWAGCQASLDFVMAPRADGDHVPCSVSVFGNDAVQFRSHLRVAANLAGILREKASGLISSVSRSILAAARSGYEGLVVVAAKPLRFMGLGAVGNGAQSYFLSAPTDNLASPTALRVPLLRVLLGWLAAVNTGWLLFNPVTVVARTASVIGRSNPNSAVCATAVAGSFVGFALPASKSTFRLAPSAIGAGVVDDGCVRVDGVGHGSLLKLLSLFYYTKGYYDRY